MPGAGDDRFGERAGGGGNDPVLGPAQHLHGQAVKARQQRGERRITPGDTPATVRSASRAPGTVQFGAPSTRGGALSAPCAKLPRSLASVITSSRPVRSTEAITGA